MKKFLLGTTALISLSAASAAMAGGSHAAADAAPANTGGLTVMVGGNFNFQSAFIGQDENTDLGNNESKGTAFRNDTTINITAAGSTEDFDYGAVVELEGDTSADKDGTAGSETNSDKTYLYVENDTFGRFEAGATAGVSQTMEVDASNIARGTGGVDGDSLYNVDLVGNNTNTATGAINTFITAPNLVVAKNDNTSPDTNKISYYTPRFSGVQLGLSFTPDTGDSGTAAGVTDNISGDYENVISAGLGFESDLEGVGLTASVVGEFGEAESTTFGSAGTIEDLSAYSAGLQLEVDGFSVAGNFADLGESGTLITATQNDESSYWTLGAAYENGAYGVSVTYLEATTGTGAAAGAGSNTGEHEFSNLVLGADYQMAPGLTPYVEFAMFDQENGSTTAGDDNSGEVVLVGAEVAF